MKVEGLVERESPMDKLWGLCKYLLGIIQGIILHKLVFDNSLKEIQSK